jgi:DNA-binding transcriptional LysR family regulator
MLAAKRDIWKLDLSMLDSGKSTNLNAMLDLDLLKTLICVVDERSFSRAAERVHRTQSTVSQQILKLEDRLGQTLLVRDRTGRSVVPTESGELLANYARRLLGLAQEAENALGKEAMPPIIRVGVPEDFDAIRMSTILSGFMAIKPDARLETVSGLSTELRRKLDCDEIDIALVKREPGAGACLASWPERLVWVTGARAIEPQDGVVRLALFPQGCLYRQRAVRALELIGRTWRVAFGSHSLSGIQAAVACGLGVTVLPTSAVLDHHVLLDERQGFPKLAPSELALVASTNVLTGEQREFVRFLVAEIGAQARARPSSKKRGTRAPLPARPKGPRARRAAI